MPKADAPPRYVLVESNYYEDDRDRAVLNENARMGPQYANNWFVTLTQMLADLTEFPGPLSHARDEDASDFYGREVRRLLYYGPTRRRGVPVRILFTLLPPDPADPPEQAETVIFLLRLLHGSQQLAAEEPPEQ